MENPINLKKIIKIAQATLLSTVLFWLLNGLNALICIYISCNPFTLYSSLLVYGFILILIEIYFRKHQVISLVLYITVYLIFFLYVIPLFVPNVSCVTGEKLNLFDENLLISIILLLLYLILFLFNFKLNNKYSSELSVRLLPIIIGLIFYFLISYNSPLNFINIYDYIFYSLFLKYN